MEIKVQCVGCGDIHNIIVSQGSYDNWKSGTMIQYAMPELSADERELLISATCGKCWWEMLGCIV